MNKIFLPFAAIFFWLLFSAQLKAQVDVRKHRLEGYNKKDQSVFKLDGLFGITDRSGKILLSGCDSIEEFTDYRGLEPYRFSGDPIQHSVLFIKDGMIGVFNDSLGITVKAKYSEAGWYDPERIFLWSMKKGKVVFTRVDKEKTEAGIPSEVLAENSLLLKSSFPARLTCDRVTYLIDSAGNIIRTWNFKVGRLLDYGNNYMITATSGVGVFDGSKKEVIVPPVYKNAGFHTREDRSVTPVIYVETKTRKFGTFDLNGHLLIDTAYGDLYDLDPDLMCFVGCGDKGCDLLDSNGKVLVRTESYFTKIYGTKLIIVSLPGGETVYNVASRNFITDKKFDAIKPVHAGLFVVENDSLYGVMNAEGKLVADPVYTNITGPFGNVFIVWKNDSSGVINGKGEILEPLSGNKWEMRAQRFDTLLSTRESMNEDELYHLDFSFANENDGPEAKPAICRAGKCEVASYEAAMNYMLYNYLVGNSVEGYDAGIVTYFERVVINDLGREYDCGPLWSIEHYFSIAGISRFSFSVKILSKGESRPEKNSAVEYLNFVFVKDHWQKFDLDQLIEGYGLESISDSIKARAEFRETDPENNVEMVDENYYPDFYFINANGIVFGHINANNESELQSIQDRVAYSEFTWKEMMPYLSKEFIAAMNQKP
jgi:hypothetical protein